ncbi:glycosyltransferase family 2 protein [Kaistella carnis]|uniref:glycosyltransferase family 2 protein n=1 Tax=Kaistella carnis TaxID=1241979 RepID=UPI0028B06620|nr:glycosyltransferase family 2 protein [Kaistella carnis]
MVTASIVLYKNDENVLLQAINSFLNSKTNDIIFLYLIDNSPTDELKRIISHPGVEYIFNPSNPGFGAAHNIAIDRAMKKGSQYHLVLNPDVYFDGNVIEGLLCYMNKNLDVGNVLPKVFYPDGSIQYLAKLLPTPYDWIGRRFNPFKKMVEKRNQTFELKISGYDKIMDAPYLSGCFMFLRIDTLRKVGLFDDKIFMYGEETDLCRRIILAGFRTVFYPKEVIYHHFEKGSHKSWHLTKIGIQSAIYYFNKWGWFFDSERKIINNRTLKSFGK